MGFYFSSDGLGFGLSLGFCLVWFIVFLSYRFDGFDMVLFGVGCFL